VPGSAWVPISTGFSGTILQPTSTPSLHPAAVPRGGFSCAAGDPSGHGPIGTTKGLSAKAYRTGLQNSPSWTFAAFAPVLFASSVTTELPRVPRRCQRGLDCFRWGSAPVHGQYRDSPARSPRPDAAGTVSVNAARRALKVDRERRGPPPAPRLRLGVPCPAGRKLKTRLRSFGGGWRAGPGDVFSHRQSAATDG
jgi:hypothetical protein